MRCIAFHGTVYGVQNIYNKWAKDKVLSRDVIIHSHVYVFEEESRPQLQAVIYVFYDENKHPDWAGIK